MFCEFHHNNKNWKKITIVFVYFRHKRKYKLYENNIHYSIKYEALELTQSKYWENFLHLEKQKTLREIVH